MKVGIRKPSLKKSLKARTTGKLKRAAKRTINPLYGKNGTGLATDPKKAIYNKVYNKTTIGISDIKLSTTNTKKSSINYEPANVSNTNLDKISTFNLKLYSIVFRILAIILILFSLAIFTLGAIGVILGILLIIFGIFIYRTGLYYKKTAQKRLE
jgi:hypothetical protein